MFFVLHADVCGKSLPHGHSHGHNHSHSHGHDDDHDHSNDDTLENVDIMINSSPLVADIVTGQNRARALKAKKTTTENINVRAAIIHVIGDFVQSVGVLCAAILIKFKVHTKQNLILCI